MSDIEHLERATKLLQLSDGRALGLAEVGDPEGPGLFFFHGWPGSRAGVLGLHDTATRLGVRLLGVDRPGIGLSSPKPGRTFLDWPQDVAEAAAQLGLSRFSVAGISGGGPYALACACKLHSQLDAVGLIAGVGPFELGLDGMRDANKQLFSLATKANWLLRFFFWMGIVRMKGDLEKLRGIVQKMLADLPEVDRKILAAPGLDLRFALELRESFRQGARWAAQEGAMYPRPWGFSLQELPNIPIFLWHGALDVNVPIQMSQSMAREAPQIKAQFFPDEGHISLLVNHADDIFRALVPNAKSNQPSTPSA